jgi:hypothetical protein
MCLYKEERCAQILQNLTISFVIRRREMNIKLISNEVGQLFNLGPAFSMDSR